MIYAAPDGLPSGAGTLANPVAARTAFANAKDGATIYLRGGVHVIPTRLDMPGSDLLIRNYGSEHARLRIDNGPPFQTTFTIFGIYGDGVRFRGMDGGVLEIYAEPTVRITTARGIYVDQGAIAIYGVSPDDGTFSSVYIHDVLGLMSQDTPGGCVADGLVIFNNGLIYDEAQWHGEGELMYLQNPLGAPLKSIRNCIFGGCYGVTVQVYAVGSDQAGIEFDGVFSFDPSSDFYAVGWRSWQLMRFTNGILLSRVGVFGRQGETYESLEITDSTIIGGVRTNEWENVAFASNTVVIRDASDYGVAYVPKPGTPVINWNNNAYYNPSSKLFEANGIGFKTFAQWQADMGFDDDSTHVTALPTTNAAFVKPLPSGLSMIANIAVLNWEGFETVTVDVSALALTEGTTYRLRSSTNPFNTAPEAENNVITFQYDGSGALHIPMTGRSMAYPFGASEPIAPLDDAWGSWVLERIA